MKFNSQICTTKEQSERLLALGLKKETADMCWTLRDSDREGNEYSVEYMSIGQGKYHLSIDETKDAVFYYDYSIGELIEMLPLNRIEFDIRNYVDTTGGLFYDDELIDALFKACVELKEEGVI